MKVRANGIQINYQVEGSGPWLVMSHSLACAVSMWDEQVEALKAPVRCTAVRRALTPSAYNVGEDIDRRYCIYCRLSMGDDGMPALKHRRVQEPGAVRHLEPDTAGAGRWDGASRPPSAGDGAAGGAYAQALVHGTFSRQAQQRGQRVAADSQHAAARYAGCCHAIPKINLTDRLGAIKCQRRSSSVTRMWNQCNVESVRSHCGSGWS